MKTVGIDSRMLGHTGIGTYLQGFLSHLEMPAQTQAVLYGRPYGPFKNHSFEAPIYSIREQGAYPSLLSQCALWHAPHYNIPWFKRRTKLVVTVHDLIHWIFRNDFFKIHQLLYTKAFFERVAKTADHIIAVSEKTREDFVAYFGADRNKISVIYEAVSPDFHPVSDPEEWRTLRERYQLPNSYFLYVGMIKPHKNVHHLVRIYRDLKNKAKVQAGLVLIGRIDPRYHAFVAEMKNHCPGLIHLENIEKGELPRFYRQAVALVHPSLYEGFGLTVLEAMASGIPVIASRAGSIPEIAGHAALLLPPHEDKPWQEALLYIESNEKRRRQMSESGLIHVKRFNWQYTAQQTASVYKKVLGL